MSEWLSVTDSLPQSCDPVIAFGKNSSGMNRIIRAGYARKFELVTDSDDDDWGDYCDEQDEYYAPEGWYEWNDAEETHFAAEFEITHWMPLPEAPK